MKKVWIPGLNWHGFWRFYFSVYSKVFVSIEKIYQTLKTVFHRSAIQTTWISSKILCCVSYFQLSSRCLDIPIKHCFSCLIHVWIYENGVKELDPKPWFQWTFRPSLGPVNGQEVEKGRQWKEDKHVEEGKKYWLCF